MQQEDREQLCTSVSTLEERWAVAEAQRQADALAAEKADADLKAKGGAVSPLSGVRGSVPRSAHPGFVCHHAGWIEFICKEPAAGLPPDDPVLSHSLFSPLFPCVIIFILSPGHCSHD